MQKIIVSGGGTAGHITPILALLPFLKEKFGEIHFFGRREGMEKELTKGAGVIYHGLDCPRLERNKPWKILSLPCKLRKAVKTARKLLEEIKPSVVFSKGGYVSLPVSLACKDVPLVLHESDTSMGLANRIALRRARAVCSSFPLPNVGGKIITHTGSPIRREIYLGDRRRALEKCGFSGTRKILLVVGGSLGAVAINELVDEEIDELVKVYDVIHLRGKGNGAKRKKGYYPIEFTNEINDYFSACDLAVTRGGGNCLFELASLKKPMLILPLPKGASRGDQVCNAEFFAQKGWALTLSQNNAKGKLLESVTRLENQSRDIVKALRNGQFDGTKMVFDIICKNARDIE